MLLAMVMAFSVSACGDDDDDDEITSIVGTKWYSANDIDGKIVSYTIFCFNQGGVLDVEHLIINDGTWYKGLSHSYRYSVNGNKLSVIYHEGEQQETFTWDGHNSPMPGFTLLTGEVLNLYNNARPDSEMR